MHVDHLVPDDTNVDGPNNYDCCGAAGNSGIYNNKLKSPDTLPIRPEVSISLSNTQTVDINREGVGMSVQGIPIKGNSNSLVQTNAQGTPTPVAGPGTNISMTGSRVRKPTK